VVQRRGVFARRHRDGLLGYLDLRYPALDWRAAYDNLARHAEKLGKRASFAETRPPA
jgi:glutathione S-transferase